MKRSSNIFRFAAIVVAAILLSACSGGGEGGGSLNSVVTASLTPASNNVPADKGSVFLTVTASGSWSISVSPNGDETVWARVSPSTGSGTKTSVVLDYDANSSTQSRSIWLRLTAGSSSSEVEFKQKGKEVVSPDSGNQGEGGSVSDAGWMELPKMESLEGYDFFHHSMTLNGVKTRNYSFYYSYNDLISMWVAYPLNAWNLTSKVKRTDKYGTLDPLVPASKQATLSGGSYKGGSYSRGHQIPSADRLASYEINVATFYSTNMTPQDYTMNGGVWANLEDKVRVWARASDTLYVVTGVVVSSASKKAYDNDGKAVTAPDGYYKALLKYKKGSTLGEYTGYAAYCANSSSAKLETMSIADLEKKTGVSFFANLGKVVGEEKAAAIKKQEPGSAWN